MSDVDECPTCGLQARDLRYSLMSVEVSRAVTRAERAEARAETAERLLRRALPFIDDAEDAHSVFSESVLTDECKELVIETRAFLEAKE